MSDYVRQRTGTEFLMAALLIAGKNLKHLKCSSTTAQVKKLWCTHKIRINLKKSKPPIRLTGRYISEWENIWYYSINTDFKNRQNKLLVKEISSDFAQKVAILTQWGMRQPSGTLKMPYALIWVMVTQVYIKFIRLCIFQRFMWLPRDL